MCDGHTAFSCVSSGTLTVSKEEASQVYQSGWNDIQTQRFPFKHRFMYFQTSSSIIWKFISASLTLNIPQHFQLKENLTLEMGLLFKSFLPRVMSTGKKSRKATGNEYVSSIIQRHSISLNNVFIIWTSNELVTRHHVGFWSQNLQKFLTWLLVSDNYF